MKKLTEEQLKFYTNIRYLTNKNDLYGADCFGLIKLINLREYNQDIGGYERTEISNLASTKKNNYFKECINEGTWKEVDVPYTGCTVVLSSLNNNIADHLGIYIEDNKMLSTNLVMRYSQIMSLEGYQVLGFYDFNNKAG